MKAVVYTDYGPPDVLHLTEVEKPTPKDNEILVRIRAVPVGFGDLLARKFNTVTPRNFSMPALFWLMARLDFGLRKPRKPILGAEFAGDVEAVGAAVTRFKPGDPVFAYPGQKMGAYAEYICMPETATVTLKPSTMTYEEAAGVPYGAITALLLLKKGGIQPGHKVLINGASGSIGSAAVQLAKQYGAEVTGVCSTPRMELVKALGADHIIDYTRDDFTQNGQTYDLIFDVLGKSSFGRCKGSLTENGRYLLASFKMKQVFQMLWTALTRRKKRVICALAIEKQDDLVTIRELVEAGAITAIIDRRYPFEQVAEAHRYIEAGNKQGNIILTWDTE
ncbi:MAG: NAD(P)-dependent alcohol dehydrogenase [Anaerolineae bacterium]|nr:NAD(P)-dependent alcohol dehydrogenase [Anaerolineae bacterium]